MDPVTTSALVGAAGSVAGGLLAGKKKASAPDLTDAINEVKAGKTEQNTISSALPDKLAPLSTAYQGNLEGAIKEARGGLDTANQEYVQGVSDTSNASYQKQAAQLKQDQLDASTAAARGMRSNLAAGGNLNSGAGVAAARNLATETANTIGKGETALSTQSLEAKQKALADVYQQDAGMVTNVLGIDQDMFTTLLNSGREDLINEATQLIQESQNATGSIASLSGAQAKASSDVSLGNAAASNDLTSAIIEALTKGGTALASRQPATAAKTA
jgi:hypothetical protein